MLSNAYYFGKMKEKPLKGKDNSGQQKVVMYHYITTHNNQIKLTK